MPTTWVQCDKCDKWRRIAAHADIDLVEGWSCDMNPDRWHNRCDIAQEPDHDLPAGLYEVEALVDERRVSGGRRRQFRVRWVGYGPRYAP